MHRRRLSGLAAVALLAVTACGNDDASSDVNVERAAAAADEGPVVGGGTLVSMGDSYISGTAGRWKGNTNGFTNIPRDLDAFRRADTGGNAYDNFGRTFPGEECFRSRSAAIHLGDGWTSINIACSNARTSSRIDEEGKNKPGIDAAGQLSYLAEIARTQRDAGQPVRMIAVSIGANDFRFGPVVTACATAFLTSSSLLPRLCSNDSEVKGHIAPAAVAEVRASIARAMGDIVATMRDAGYADDAWVLVSHNYPSPLPPASALRYSQRGYDRQVKGGCPLYDADVDWFATWMTTANGTVGAAIADAQQATGKVIVALDQADLFEGRRLCERGTKLVEETTDDVDLLRYAERVDMIRLTSKLPGSPYNINEGVHPNYLGQLAIRACLRQAFNEGDARSGTCGAPADWGVVNELGEPKVVFTPA